MAKKQRTEGQAKRDLVKFCAFVALIVAAFTFTFGGLFNGSVAGDILDLIAKLALLVAIAFPAYTFSLLIRSAGDWVSYGASFSGLRLSSISSAACWACSASTSADTEKEERRFASAGRFFLYKRRVFLYNSGE